MDIKGYNIGYKSKNYENKVSIDKVLSCICIHVTLSKGCKRTFNEKSIRCIHSKDIEEDIGQNEGDKIREVQNTQEEKGLQNVS